jgi:hypothetical protein
MIEDISQVRPGQQGSEYLIPHLARTSTSGLQRAGLAWKQLPQMITLCLPTNSCTVGSFSYFHVMCLWLSMQGTNLYDCYVYESSGVVDLAAVSAFEDLRPYVQVGARSSSVHGVGCIVRARAHAPAPPTHSVRPGSRPCPCA